MEMIGLHGCRQAWGKYEIMNYIINDDGDLDLLEFTAENSCTSKNGPFDYYYIKYDNRNTSDEKMALIQWMIYLE